MLKAIDLHKKYKVNEVVKGVNLELHPGESVGLVGPNGAGKSTTISILSSLISPTKGTVQWNGVSIEKNLSIFRRQLGLVPQEIALYPELSAKENLMFFGRVYGLKGEALSERIEYILKKIGLMERQNDLVKTYSGGMKRRLNIGIALLHKPSILIMDEPTVGIDPQSRAHILETVKQLVDEGMTLLYTSHYMEEVELLCDRIYIINQGEVVASGTKEELKNLISENQTIELKGNFTESFIAKLKEVFLEATLRHEEKVIYLSMDKNITPLKTIFDLASQDDIQIISVSVQTPTLEDVFLHLTGRELRD